MPKDLLSETHAESNSPTGVAIYARGRLTDIYVKYCLDYCQSNSITVAQNFVISDENPRKLSGLIRLLAAIEEGEITTLVCWQLDQVLTAQHASLLTKLVEQKKVRFIVVDENEIALQKATIELIGRHKQLPD